MTIAIQDHKDFLTSLTADQRVGLTQKSNHPAVLRLLVLSSCILLLAVLIGSQTPYWPVLLLPLGILLVFLFTLMHETSHGTAFKSTALNRWVSYVCGWILFLPPAWFRYFHLAHHRHTQNPEKDPELQSSKPTTWPRYLIHSTGATVWLGSFRALTRNALGHADNHYIPASAHDTLCKESRFMLIGYLVCLLVSMALSTTLLLKIWIIPIVLGQPFLRLYLLAEHGGCALSSNMFDNTRTTFTTGALRFLSWNMSYHTEHHVYPTVPFHRLPKMHTLLDEHLRQTANGYYHFNRQFAGSLK